MCGDLVPVDDPFQRRLSIHLIVIGFLWRAGQRDVLVEDNLGSVLTADKRELFHAVEVIGIIGGTSARRDFLQRVRTNSFVVQVQFRQGPARRTEARKPQQLHRHPQRPMSPKQRDA